MSWSATAGSRRRTQVPAPGVPWRRLDGPAELYEIHLVWNLPRRCSLGVWGLLCTKKRKRLQLQETRRSLAETELVARRHDARFGIGRNANVRRHLIRWIVADGTGVSGPLQLG